MALRGALEHPKTLALADALGIMDCFALGILEAFWHHVGKYHEDGDVTNLKPSVMARSIRYTGDAQLLWDSLIQAGFLDDLAGRVIVHGWSERADDATQAKMYRAVKRFADGSQPKARSIGKHEREKLEQAWTDSNNEPDSGRTVDGQLATVLPVPEPVPEPEPVLKKPTVSISCAAWDEFLAVYPKRKGDLCKAKGEEKFKSLLKSGQSPGEIIAGAKRYSDFLRATDKYATEFVKQIPTFLNGRAWEESWDVPSPPGLLSKIERLNAEREARGA